MGFVLGVLGFVAASTTFSVILCEIFKFLTPTISVLSLLFGVVAGFAVYRATRNVQTDFKPLNFYDYAFGFLFIVFCYRFFLWIDFPKGPNMYTLDANNFGDLPFHINVVKNLAITQFWPDNPIISFDKFHYPFGMDMFSALFLKLGVPLENSLPVMGLGLGLLFLWALQLWGGWFTVGSFLFSGGIAGYAAFGTSIFKDYQGDLAWKSLPLAVYLTQRGFLYAFPAGLILLWSWRRRYILKLPGLPLFIEGLIWGTMPLFHVHTFIFLSLIFAIWVVATKTYREGLKIFSWAVLPATYEMLRLTDAFQKSSLISFKAGWMIEKQNIFKFFWINYGLYVPLTLATLFLVTKTKDRRQILLAWPAAGIYIMCLFVMFAPWDWDNTKLMVWTYLLVLPVISDVIIDKIQDWLKVPLVVSLFASGFICVYSVYANPTQGFEMYNREELHGVCQAVRDLPVGARFATAQTHNHPVALCGRLVAAGYAGHLWSHGIVNHEVIETKLRRLMTGDPEWRKLAAEIDARFIFWGPSEERSYVPSTRPWEANARKIAEGSWGKIFDLGEK